MGEDQQPGELDRRRSASSQYATAEDIAVVSLVLQQMTLLEGRLGAKIDSVISMTTERWRIHEKEHALMDSALEGFSHQLAHHLKDEERAALVYDARMGVLKRAWFIAVREWRTIAILAFLLLDFGTQVANTIQHFFMQ